MARRIYLSSRFSTNREIERAWIKRVNPKYRCFSFAHVVKGNITGYYSSGVAEALEVCVNSGVGIMMDSGAHSLHKLTAQSKLRNDKAYVKQSFSPDEIQEKMFEDYAAYCKKEGKQWDFYLTLDYKKHQPSIFAMQQRFMKKRLKPIPVYHGDDSLDWLRKYRDIGCSLVCLGSDTDFRGSSHRGLKWYFDKVFDFGAKHDIQFHGLAVTSLSMITSWPWYSVDSSTWSRNAIHGLILFPDHEHNKIQTFHISDRFIKQDNVVSYNRLSRKHRQQIDETLRGHGFDAKEMRSGTAGLYARHDYNGWVYNNLDKLVDMKVQEGKHVRWKSLF